MTSWKSIADVYFEGPCHYILPVYILILKSGCNGRRLEDDTVRCAYPTDGIPLLAFLGRRCSSRGWTDPALSDPANISPARRYATVVVVAPTRLSFARKPLRAELVSRSTCARSGIPERRANKISTCEIYARFFLFHVESDSNGESVDRRCATRFLSFCKFSLRKISSSSKLGMDVCICIIRFRASNME